MSARQWPPLIAGKGVPRWARARDFLLTLAAWVLLAWWTRHALALAWDWLSVPMFEFNEHEAPDWKRIWGVLVPFFALAALLSGWLFYWSQRRRRVLTQQVDLEQPAALAADVQGLDFGLGTEEVAALRGSQVATVEFDALGGIAGLRI